MGWWTEARRGIGSDRRCCELGHTQKARGSKMLGSDRRVQLVESTADLYQGIQLIAEQDQCLTEPRLIKHQTNLLRVFWSHGCRFKCTCGLIRK